MIEVYPDLFVGGAADLIHADSGSGSVDRHWFVVTAAKDPWHRELLGYTGRGAPKDHPEYLFAKRERRLFLNLVDAADPAFVRDELLAAAIEAIDERPAETKALIHCNQGQSRAPMLALLWLRFGEASRIRPFLSRLSFDDAMAAFKEVYPPLEPADGIKLAVQQRWEEAGRD